MNRWEAYKKRKMWRYLEWRKTIFTDLIMNAILYLGYCGEAPSLTVMARELECEDKYVRWGICKLLQQIGCISILPYKREKRVRLTDKGWRVFVLMEAIHIVFENDNKDLINLTIENNNGVYNGK